MSKRFSVCLQSETLVFTFLLFQDCFLRQCKFKTNINEMKKKLEKFRWNWQSIRHEPFPETVSGHNSRQIRKLSLHKWALIPLNELCSKQETPSSLVCVKNDVMKRLFREGLYFLTSPFWLVLFCVNCKYLFSVSKDRRPWFEAWKRVCWNMYGLKYRLKNKNKNLESLCPGLRLSCLYILIQFFPDVLVNSGI